jgi:hypothetical protein
MGVGGKMNRRRLLLLCIIAVLLAIPLLGAGAYERVDGVSFLASGSVGVTFPVGEDQVVLDVSVFNGSQGEQTIALDVVRFLDQTGAGLPPGALESLPAPAVVGAAQVHTFSLTLKRVDGLSSAYAGELVAYSSDGSLARLAMELKVASPPAAAPDGRGVDPAYLSSLTLKAVKWFPIFLEKWFGSAIETVSFQVAEAYSRPERIVGQVSGENGLAGRVRQAGASIFVEDLTHAGEYSGKLDLLPGQTGGELDLVVKVRDAFYFALLSLIAGLIVAGRLDHLVKVRRPRVQLVLRLAQIREMAVSTQEQALQNLSPAWKDRYGDKVLLIYQPGDEQEEQPKSLLGREMRRIRENFDQAGSDSERQKWGVLGEPVTRLESNVDTLRVAHELSRDAFENLQTAKDLEIPNFDMLPVVIQVLEACHPEPMRRVDELSRKTEKLKTVSAFLGKYVDLYLRVLKLSEKFKNPPEQDEVKEVLQQLQSTELNNAGFLERLEGILDRLALTPAVPSFTKAGAGAQPAAGTLSVPARPIIDLSGLLELLKRPRERVSQDSVSIRNLLRDLDNRYAFAAGVIALASGFSVTYLSNPVYGSPADYLNTFLWSTTVSAGIQIARHFLPLK